MATLHWELRDILPELRVEGRLNVLTAMLLHANIRLRCYPSLDLLVKETGFEIEAVNKAKKFLLARGFAVKVPYKLRVDDERKLPNRQNVYQLTGLYTLDGKVQHYLYMTPEAFSELSRRVVEIKQFHPSTSEVSTTETSTSETSTVEGKGITTLKGGSTTKGNAKSKGDSPADAGGTQPAGSSKKTSKKKQDTPVEEKTTAGAGEGPTPPGSGASPSPFREIWEAVNEVWGHDGFRAGNIAAMIAGTSQVKGWKEFNFTKPGNALGVRVFKDWYAQTCKGAALPEDGEGIQTWYGKMRRDYDANPDKAVFDRLRQPVPSDGAKLTRSAFRPKGE